MQREERQQDQDGVVADENQLLDPQTHSSRLGFILVFIIICTVAALPLVLQNGGMGLFVLIYLGASVLWIFSASRVPSLSLPAIVTLAVLLRIAFMFADPSLSGDVYRYRWDGRTSVAGINPYASAPAASPEASRPVWFGRINHAEIPTIYPPVAQLLFFLWARGIDTLAFWRLMLLGFDLVTILIIAALGGRRTALVYAICPLVLVEGFWSAHLEVAVTAALLLSVGALLRRREIPAALACALAIGLKITPVAIVPVMIREARRRWKFAAVLIASVLAPLLPFLGHPLMPGASDYARRWSFNSPLFQFVRWVLVRESVASQLKNAFTAIKDSAGLEMIAPMVYAHLYPDYLARLLLGIVWLVGLSVLTIRVRPLVDAAAEAFVLLIVLSPTIHPWYLLPLLPLALIADRPEFTLLAIMAPASYLLYLSPEVQPLVFLLCYGVPILGWVVARRRAVQTVV